MAESGIEWIDVTFDLAVRWLYALAEFLGITYEEINVWLFCIVWPLSMIGAALWIWALQRKNRSLRARVASLQQNASTAGGD